jgi:hypothetical protein
VGWVEPSFLYLQPDSSYKVVQKFGQGMSDGLNLTPRTLRKRFKDKGLLILDDSRPDHLTIRKVIEGQRREVLCLSLSSFISLSPQPDQLNQKNTGNDKKLSLNGPDGPVLTRDRISRTPRARRQSRLF